MGAALHSIRLAITQYARNRIAPGTASFLLTWGCSILYSNHIFPSNYPNQMNFPICYITSHLPFCAVWYTMPYINLYFCTASEIRFDSGIRRLFSPSTLYTLHTYPSDETIFLVPNCISTIFHFSLISLPLLLLLLLLMVVVSVLVYPSITSFFHFGRIQCI